MNNEQVKGYIICESPAVMQTPQIVTSSKCNRVIIETKLQDADVLNRNKRIYPKKTLESGLNSDYVKERIATGTFFGEAGHPLKPDIQRQLYMDQSNISHRVNSFWWEGNVLKGYVEAANTARGNDFDGLVRQGCKVGFSLRAVGPITEKRGDTVIVKDPLTIFAYDWIIHPSHACAYMDKIVSESGSVIMSESAGIMIPIIQDKAIDYIRDQSKNFKIIAESFDLDETNKKNIFLSENAKEIYIKNDHDTIVVKTEDYISREITNYMRKFR